MKKFWYEKTVENGYVYLHIAYSSNIVRYEFDTCGSESPFFEWDVGDMLMVNPWEFYVNDYFYGSYDGNKFNKDKNFSYPISYNLSKLVIKISQNIFAKYAIKIK